MGGIFRILPPFQTPKTLQGAELSQKYGGNERLYKLPIIAITRGFEPFRYGGNVAEMMAESAEMMAELILLTLKRANVRLVVN